MGELQTALGTIFITRMVFGNLTEIGVPLLKYKWRMFREQRSMGKNAAKLQYTKPENESKLNKYEEMESFDDYAEMVLQFGYVTLFVVAFPLAPLLAFINNVLEVHVDSFKLCYGHRRPWPRSASSIGTWAYFLSLMSTMSVITNVGLLIFTADIEALPSSTGGKWLLFVVSEHLLLMFKKAVMDLIPDVPRMVKKVLARFKWLEQRVFLGQQVEADSSHLREQAEVLDLDIDGKLAIHPHPSATGAAAAASGAAEAKVVFNPMLAQGSTHTSAGKPISGQPRILSKDSKAKLAKQPPDWIYVTTNPVTRDGDDSDLRPTAQL